MKVITIKQPFATLIAEGLKEYEFRSWKTQFHGDLLIHAGKSVDKDAMKRFNEQGLEYPLGCIIAKVKMTDCIRVDSNFRKILSEKNPAFMLEQLMQQIGMDMDLNLKMLRKLSQSRLMGNLDYGNMIKCNRYICKCSGY